MTGRTYGTVKSSPPLLPVKDWEFILARGHVKPAVIQVWAPVFHEVITARSFSKGRAEIDDFLGQVLHESMGLTKMEENLNYSAHRLTKVWPSRFPNIAAASPYAGNPEKLANKVYGGRMGNKAPGDGWLFRGRGPIGLTGLANYAFVGDLIGQDLVGIPDLMTQPRYALEATVAWWEDRIPDSMLGDPEKVTNRVNGGLIGLAEREELTASVQGGIEKLSA